MSDSSSLSDHDHDDKKEEVDPGLSNPSVIDKYRDAAKVANRVMKELIELSGIGANVYELCAKGDELIELYVKEFHGKVKSKGVAFPTSVSVNNCCGNYSPMSQNESISLKQGDVAKIDLGVHIDGYISTVAHTIVVGTFENPITGSIADVICAAYFASQCALRLIKPGKTNTEVTNAILRCAQVFNVNPLQGVLSHQLTRDNIDEKKVIINKAEVDQVVEEFQFELNQVYSVDIVMSTGEGKSRQIDSKTTIYKRNKDVSYNLKNNSSRKLFSDIKNKHNTRPFNVRNFPVRERVGMKELINHELVHAYPVLYEKNNQIVAQFKFTVLILSSSTQNINEDFPLPWVTSDYKLESDTFLSQIMATSTKNKKKKKKKPVKKTQTENVPQEETKEPIVQEEKQGETN